jgi:hypothetical protein
MPKGVAFDLLPKAATPAKRQPATPHFSAPSRWPSMLLPIRQAMQKWAVEALRDGFIVQAMACNSAWSWTIRRLKVL